VEAVDYLIYVVAIDSDPKAGRGKKANGELLVIRIFIM